MPNAWELIQTRDVDGIVAEVFRQMDGCSCIDPTAPWADLALALCQRIKTAEAAFSELKRATEAVGNRREGDGWCCCLGWPHTAECERIRAAMNTEVPRG